MKTDWPWLSNESWLSWISCLSQPSGCLYIADTFSVNLSHFHLCSFSADLYSDHPLESEHNDSMGESNLLNSSLNEERWAVCLFTTLVLNISEIRTNLNFIKSCNTVQPVPFLILCRLGLLEEELHLVLIWTLKSNDPVLISCQIHKRGV